MKIVSIPNAVDIQIGTFLHDKFEKLDFKILKQNNDKFGYERFDFLLLNDKDKLEDNLAELNNRITKFFND